MTAADRLAVSRGNLDVSDDPLVPTFFDWFGSPPTILVLESGDGGLCLQLAARVTTERVLGLDRDEANVARARLASELIGQENVEFAVGDLETANLASYGRFDAVFCVDVFGRLAAPWLLLADAARIGDRLFVDAPYWQEARVVEVDGHRGGFVDGSFWLTRPALLEALTTSGWAVRYLADLSRQRSRSRLLLGCVRP